MKINKLILGIAVTISSFVYAQNTKKEVLFTIEGKPYYTDEFSRIYNKNIDLVKDESQKDLNQYLDLFIGYKLKIEKAYKIGLQNNVKYINELASYRQQLARNYTSDAKVTKALVDEAYARSLKEVRASHILLLCDENASGADTLKVYNQVLDIRKKALAGEDFASLAEKFSQDPSAKENKGDLGYFSVFRMVYPFENAAYKTKIGDVSMPVRTKFGYHLIKVADVRDNRGEVTVAHIMLTKQQSGTPEEVAKLKSTIQDIYTKLKQGEKFEDLANQFSQDKNSASRGGVLPKFGSGQLSSEEFENKSFGLNNVGDYTEPFETQFGWHIVKLVQKHPIKKLEESSKELENKIIRDERSRLIEKSVNDKIKMKYPVVRDEKLYNKIKSIVTDKYYTAEWNLPENIKDYDGTLLTVGSKKINGTTFLSELDLLKKGKITSIKPIGKLVDFHYKNFADDQLKKFYNENLENEYPDFANIVSEYRDGLLLFDLMEREIWNKSKQDTLGLKDYFSKNQAKYVWKNRAKVITASSTKEDFAKQAQKLLKKDTKTEEIKEKLNTKDVVNIIFKEDTYEEGASNFPKNVTFKTGVSNVFKDGDHFFVNKVTQVLPAGNKSFDEARGKIINDYQQYLEDNWVSELKKEFKVQVNQEVFERLKSEMKK